MVGPSWRRGIARVFFGKTGAAGQVHTKDGAYARDGWFVPAEVWADFSYYHKEALVMGWIRDLRGSGGLAGGPRDSVDRDWLSRFPALHEYLTMGKDASGAVRRTSTVTIFADAGGWKVYLNERHASASLCATGDSVDGALSALEVMLEADNTPWRFSVLTPPEGRTKRRKGS